jgi:hypothetical protein
MDPKFEKFQNNFGLAYLLSKFETDGCYYIFWGYISQQFG